jgi:uncharacterized RDD family membrane protein YckC
VVDRRDIGSWLDGPGGGARSDQDYPGQRLGRPQDGDGSLGGLLRRFGGLVVDWTIASVIARAIAGDDSWTPLVIFLAQHLLLVSTIGTTIGHRVFGLRVETLAGAHPGPLKAVVRSLLLVLVIPPLVMDADQRGLHDRAVGTLVARR